MASYGHLVAFYGRLVSSYGVAVAIPAAAVAAYGCTLKGVRRTGSLNYVP